MKDLFIIDTVKKIGEVVELYGWVDSKRDHKKIVFIDLRDRSGIVQVVGGEDFKQLSNEDVVMIKGLIKSRPDKLNNTKMATGTVEIEAKELKIISKAKTLPIPINDDGYSVNEESRLKYRYLDIRRARMLRNLTLKSKATLFIRNYLSQQNFLEIDTPILTKTTPEGARDFLVPSRLQPGNFYALPQSPQQYKQMLMVAGIERYFQFARCFRDEDPRADRAYGEFTQLDLEMSFIEQNDILLLIEDLFTKLVKELFPEKYISQTPWPRIAHKEAKQNYGTDKPDLRKNKKDPNELAFSWTVDFPLFTEQSQDDFFHGSGKAKFAPSHHMFTAPHPDDIPLLDSDPLKVRGLQHDLVLNGFEVGGGSIRIHQPEVQQKVFDLIGFTVEQKQQFSHMLEAFSYGVPPHGGIAPGLDRLLMAILGEPSVREVIAFPASSGGKISIMDAPSPAADEQLKELGIKVDVIIKKKANINNSPVKAFDKIIDLLKSKNVKYEVYEHKAVFTSEEAAKIRNTGLKLGAKAMVLYADKKPIMLVLPADQKIDLKKFKQEIKIKKLSLSTPEEVKKITGIEIGAIPPFGSIFNIPLYVDEKLKENIEIVFNAGEHTKSIKMSCADYLKVAQPIIANFSKQ